MPRVSERFGEAVRQVLEERGLGRRQQTIRTGLDHVTVGKMANGIVPGLETVERFARGFDLDVNAWRELAGYRRVDTVVITHPDSDHIGSGEGVDESREAADYLNRRLAEVEAEFGIEVSADLAGGTGGLTREKADALVDAYRERLKQRKNN